MHNGTHRNTLGRHTLNVPRRPATLDRQTSRRRATQC